MGFRYVVNGGGQGRRRSCNKRKYRSLVHLLIEALVEPPLGLRLRLWLGDPLLSAFNNLKGNYRFLF